MLPTNKEQFLPTRISRQALTGVAQWIERRTAMQRVTDLVLGQSTCLGCGPGSQ